MKCRGFSLAELLVALTLAALLLCLGAPVMAQQRAAAALRSATGQVMAALHLGRRLALARGQVVTVCASADGVRCGFAGGEWLLFANAPGGSDSRLETGDQILRRWTLPAGVTVTGSRGYAAFQPRPAAAATVTFDFHHAQASHAHRSIVVSQTGRPRLALAQ